MDERAGVAGGGWAAMPGESIEVGFRGTADGEAALVFGDGSRIPLVEQSRVVEVPWGRRVFGAVPPAPEPSVPGLAEYRGVVVARPLLASEPDVPRPTLAPLLASTPSGAAVELRVGGHVGTVRLMPGPEAVEVLIEVDRQLPYRIDSRGRSLDITIYGGIADTGWLMSGGLDRHVIGARWSQPADGLWVLTLDLAQPHWGHTAAWNPNGDLVVRVRRPPSLDWRRPLRGLVVAVDPGHPPGGAMGPTGLSQAEVNLAVTIRLARMLQRPEAQAIRPRTHDTALGLYERAQIAEAAGAHLFVSLHQNAFPDGVDPFVDSGTSTFYFHPHAEALARALQAELIHEFRLRDLGVGRTSLAVLRLTWMPAALTETMFMMVPHQEAALRDADVLERIARAHLRALERFLRERR